MRQNLKFLITVLLCAFLAMTLLYFVNEWYRNIYDRDKWEYNFYSQDFDPNKKKLFMLGSSQLVRINQTYIEDYLSKNNHDYDVYNLGRPLDLPDSRIGFIDEIILAKPNIVLYGIGFRDAVPDSKRQSNENRLDIIPTAQLDKTPTIQPFPEFIVDDFYTGIIFGIDFDNLKNPKFVSLEILKMLQQGSIGDPGIMAQLGHTPKHPIAGIIGLPILADEKLGYEYRNIEKFGRLVDPNGQNALALKKIVSELTSNDIKVMLLVFPHHRTFLEHVSNEDMELFFSLTREISDKYDVKIIDLHNKYSDLSIWNDFLHVAYNVNSTIYYDDLSREILEGISTIDNNKDMKKN